MKDITIITGVSKKTGNPYEAIKVTIGSWSTFVFPRSRFEMDYIKSVLEGKK